jgi:hypothetical protein
MPTDYDAAVEALYRGPVDTFVAERKRLAAELKTAGKKDDAARLAKLGRPSLSAWVVNQLWWHEREAVERLFAAAERVKQGKRDAPLEHRDALGALRALARARLESGGHSAAEATLRRVTTTLSALAASGGFDPDPPGALANDRDPPGFEALGFGFELEPRAEAPAPQAKHPAKHEAKHAQHDGAGAKRSDHDEEAERERKRAAEERERLAQERARKKAERDRLTVDLRAAHEDVTTLLRDAERLRHELRGVESKLEKAQQRVEKLKNALSEIGEVR